MPGFFTTTTCPRTGTTAGSGTSDRAPTPVQFTTTAASGDDSDVTGSIAIEPPSDSKRRTRYSRYTGIVTTGAVYRHPDTNPDGSSSAASSRWSASRSSHSGGVASFEETSRPLTGRTPAAGSSVSAEKTSSPTRAHSRHRSAGPQFTGPHTAPAATDVVRPGGSAATTRVATPASASEIAVLSPTTPAPTTTASAALMPRRYRTPAPGSAP